MLGFSASLTATEYIYIRYYLSKKWGLTASIDSDEDGLSDADEDVSNIGTVDVGETDPTNPNTDNDESLDGYDAFPLDPYIVGDDFMDEASDFSDDVNWQIPGQNNDVGDTFLEGNLTLWLDSNNFSGPYEDKAPESGNFPLQTWVDKSNTDGEGAGNHATQIDSTKRPTLTSLSGPVTFSGAGLFLKGSDGDFKTVIMVLEQDSLSGTHRIFSKGDGSDQSLRFITGDLNATPDSNKDWHAAGDSYVDGVNTHEVGSGRHIVQVTRSDGDWFDGQGYFLSSTDALEFFNGKLYEVLAFDKQLTDEEQEKVTEYLGEKWNVELDSDGDGILNSLDNSCGPNWARDPLNPVDTDGDGLYDVCEDADYEDLDDDNDGVDDDDELDGAVDTDGDGLINQLDPDSDGDQWCDGAGTACSGLSGDNDAFPLDINIWERAASTRVDLSTVVNSEISRDVSSAEGDLVVWLDGSDYAGVATGFDSTPVALRTWVDQSGNGNHVVQADSAKRPSVQTGAGDLSSSKVVGFGAAHVLSTGNVSVVDKVVLFKTETGDWEITRVEGVQAGNFEVSVASGGQIAEVLGFSASLTATCS